MKPKKHAELIKAWADGAQIQVLSSGFGGQEWVNIDCPSWHEGSQYRKKPELVEVKVRVKYLKQRQTLDVVSGHLTGKVNLMLTFNDDGDLLFANVLS